VEKYLFMPMVLQKLAQEKFFRKICVIALQVLAVVAGFAGITGFVQIWNYTSRLQGSVLPGGVIFILFFVVAVYMVVHTLWIRSQQLQELPEAEFCIVHIAASFIRLVGELYACLAVPVAVGGGIFIWFGQGGAKDFIKNLFPLLKSFGEANFLGGIEFILGGVFYALFVLLFCYLLAELLVILLDLTMNTRFTRQIVEQYDKKGVK